jgi:hypothetical protein
VLVYLPAFKLAPPVPDTGTSFEDFAHRKALRKPGAMGGIMADLPQDNTPQVAKKVFFTAVDAEAGPWVKSVLPDAETLDESAKQAIFISSAEKTVAVLVYEFFTGKGPARRTFDETSAIVQNIMQGRIADEILGNYWDRVKAGDPASPLVQFRGVYRFSPDQGSRGESADKFIESTDQLLHGDPVLAFLGAVTWEAKPSPDGNTLDVKVSNDTSLSSYAVHEVESVPRAPQLFQIVSPDGPQDLSSDFPTPYTTTTQVYKFTLPVR